jgi:hypothetical protein
VDGAADRGGNSTERMMSASIRDSYTQNEAWDEKEETNSEEIRSDETVTQVNSMR